jgi:23S rRNA pseudouridine1911/1915/1917 synthase
VTIVSGSPTVIFPSLNLPADPDILLEDGAVFVMNKPGGLLTQGPPGIDSLELRTKHFLKVRDQKPGKVYLGVPHRLDRPVSGAITVVKNVRAAQRISRQLEERTVTKTYWAVVEGRPEQNEGRLEHWMRKIPDRAMSEVVEQTHPDAKQAILDFRVLARSEELALLEIELQTGRTHQIRLQCSEMGWPIAGDSLYGAVNPFGPETEDERQRWIALHARRLAFEHPISKTPVDQLAPLSDYWRVFEEFGSVLFE